MKNRSSFIITFISVNLFFVFFLVYKKSKIVELSFTKQQHEKTKMALLKERERLQQQLSIAQNKTSAATFARNELKMEKIKPKQIITLPTS